MNLTYFIQHAGSMSKYTHCSIAAGIPYLQDTASLFAIRHHHRNVTTYIGTWGQYYTLYPPLTSYSFLEIAF